MLIFNYQYCIYPSADQAAILDDWFETSRRVYNYALREIKDWSQSRKCPVNACDVRSCYIIPADAPYPSEQRQQASLAKAKQVVSNLKTVPAQNLQQAIKRLHKSFEAKRKRGFGYPRLKKFGQWHSTLFPQFKASPLDAEGKSLKLPKLGDVTINLHRPIPEGFTIANVRVVKKADHWFANLCIKCDVEVPVIGFHGHAIGVDVGLDYFLATSDGLQVKAPKFFKQSQSKLKLLQRRLARKTKRSANYQKARIAVARQHRHIANQRRDLHFKLAHQLCDGADSIFFEDIDFRIMAKGFLGKHTLDAGWGQFRNITKQVAFKRGKFSAEVDHRGTSQKCPDCGAEVRKELADRVHSCHACGSVKPRDVASGQVIRNRGVALYSTIVPVEHREMETA
ncbi:MAG: transposase [Leptolyngbya foveolarum]|uniref:Transposase n=1 Tax=Leptolyngbya foveolarum TaxID=47253 RepID=A0A2W4UGP4_9CYAN|nr:MAG: transposase [Leptolyngbya foveolarum]